MSELTLEKLMGGYSPSATYEGFATADDYVFAIDITENGAVDGNTPIKNYIVAEMGVKGISKSLNPEEQTNTYLRAGASTTKTGTQKTITIEADRYLGDKFQDFCLSRKIIYGTGQEVIVPYVDFNVLTGKGEIGRMSIMVDSDSDGNAGENATVSINFSKVGAKPLELDWVTDKDKNLSELENPTQTINVMEENYDI